MLGLAPGVEGAPLLRVEGGRRPASGFEETHQLVAGYAFARHSAGRPPVNDERFDRVVGLAFFAAFDHEGNETRGSGLGQQEMMEAVVRLNQPAAAALA